MHASAIVHEGPFCFSECAAAASCMRLLTFPCVCMGGRAGAGCCRIWVALLLVPPLVPLPVGVVEGRRGSRNLLSRHHILIGAPSLWGSFPPSCS